MASSVCAYTIGSIPSVSPARNTTSHSCPLAACSEARVTPSIVGACPMALRAASSAARSPSDARGDAAKKSSASCASASSDSHRSRARPWPDGACGLSPIPDSTALTWSAGSSSADAERAAARSRPTAWRTSARSKNRSAPLTANGTPTSPRACSNAGVCALVRTSTAISRGAVPDRISAAARRATAAASSWSSSYSANSGSAPAGR